MYKLRIILLALSFSSCNGQTIQWKEYNGKTFSISSPINWERTKNLTEDTFIFKSTKESSSDKFQENFNVIIQDLGSKGMSLKEYSDLTYNQVKQAIGEKSILDFKKSLLSGQTAKEMSYLLPSNPSRNQFIDLKVWQKWIIKDNKAYVVTFTAQKEKYDSYIEMAEKMFNLFKVK
ncbi:hypothetical protein [Lacinutrix chionoecetis]